MAGVRKSEKERGGKRGEEETTQYGEISEVRLGRIKNPG